MCFACGGWPWNRHLQLAAEPVKQEYIFLDDNVEFYEDRRTGIHPPAPVYQSNQPSQPAMYYFAGNSTAPAGYYANGLYYGNAPPAATSGWPYTCYPVSNTPAASPFCATYGYSPYYTAPYQIPTTTVAPWMQASASAQAAAAVAANAALQQMPNAPAFFVGTTTAEMQAQNAILAAHLAATQSQPTMLAPYKPGSSPQFWCKELDGSWTLREYADTLKGDFPPGHWERHGTSGYYYYVRHSS